MEIAKVSLNSQMFVMLNVLIILKKDLKKMENVKNVQIQMIQQKIQIKEKDIMKEEEKNVQVLVRN